MLKVWSREIRKKIEVQLESIYRKDYKFFKIDRLEDMAEHIDIFSEKCPECQYLKAEVEDIAENLSDFMYGSSRKRAEYEKRTEKIFSHLKHKHNLKQRGYYASLYPFYGLLIGSLIGLIFGLLSFRLLRLTLLLGFAGGLIIGRVLGKNKDRYYEKNNLIL